MKKKKYNNILSGDDIKQKLHYFTQVEHLSQRLSSPTMSVNSEAFFIVLAKIDECLDYMKNNVSFWCSHYCVIFLNILLISVGITGSPYTL